jgi:hypothetical protein
VSNGKTANANSEAGVNDFGKGRPVMKKRMSVNRPSGIEIKPALTETSRRGNAVMPASMSFLPHSEFVLLRSQR